MPHYDDIKKLVSILITMRDPWNHHESSVAHLVEKMATALDLSPDDTCLMSTGAYLHDIGKVLVRPELLKLSRKLDQVERSEIQTHAVLGWVICEQAGYHPTILEIVRHHHEKWDGSGYPDGIAGTDIPLGARIVCICDYWNALTTPRSYRGAYSFDFAVKLMQQGRGKEFDPALLDLFFNLVLSPN